MEKEEDTSLLLLDLPDEILCTIIFHIPLRDIFAFAQTCKRIMTIASDNRVWKVIYHRNIPLLTLTHSHSPVLSSSLPILMEEEEDQTDWKEKVLRNSYYKSRWRSKKQFMKHVVKFDPKANFQDQSVFNLQDACNWSVAKVVKAPNHKNFILVVDSVGVLHWLDSCGRPIKREGKRTQLRIHDGFVWWFEQKDNLVVSGGLDGMITVTNLDSMKIEQKIKHGEPIWVVDFSFKDDLIVCGCQSGNVCFYSLSTGKEILQINERSAGIFDLKYIEGDEICLIGHMGSEELIVFSMVQEEELFRIKLRDAAHSITCIEIFEGKAFVGNYAGVTVYSLKTGKAEFFIDCKGMVGDLEIMFGKIIAGVALDAGVTEMQVWDLATHEQLYAIPILQKSIRVLSLSVVEDLVICCTRCGHVVLNLDPSIEDNNSTKGPRAKKQKNCLIQ